MKVSEDQKNANAKISSYQNMMEGHTEVIVTTEAGHKVITLTRCDYALRAAITHYALRITHYALRTE